MAVRSIEILLVEDNPADVMFTRLALEDARLLNRLHVAEDGAAALSYLRREPPHQQAAVPDLILLDLHLPGIDGWEVLQEIRRDPALTHIPVVVLTTSLLRDHVARAYRELATCYIVKPVDRAQFMNAVRGLRRFWLDIVRLPAAGA